VATQAWLGLRAIAPVRPSSIARLRSPASEITLEEVSHFVSISK
jgi:hypothetical protein